MIFKAAAPEHRRNQGGARRTLARSGLQLASSKIVCLFLT